MTTPTEVPPPGGTASLGDRNVARIGYGAMQLERLHRDPDAAVALVRRAIEAGVTHIDTAEFYGEGFVNDVLHQAVRVDRGVCLATKVGADANPGGPIRLRPAQKPAELRQSVEDNLRTLRRDHVQLVYLRRLDVRPGLTASGDQLVPIDDQLETLAALREEGKIGAIGLSAVTMEGLRAALPAGITAVQNAYSVIARGDEAMLELCRREGVAWVPFFPLGGAFPGSPKVADNELVRAAAAARGVTPSQMGLAWLLHHAPNVLLVPGTASAPHLDENLAVGTIQLSAAQAGALDRVGLVPPG
jgi:pyridoxine 4-dehydrogenase